MDHNYVLLNDQELMELYKEGDEEAFEQIFKRHQVKVYGYLLKRSVSSLTEDIFQATWMKFHQSKHLYQPQYPIPQWLFVIARSVLTDHFRKESKKNTKLVDLAVDPKEMEPSSFSEIETHLSQLTPEQRYIVEMRVMGEKSFEEIAQKVGKTPMNIRQILGRTLKKLRLKKEGKFE